MKTAYQAATNGPTKRVPSRASGSRPSAGSNPTKVVPVSPSAKKMSMMNNARTPPVYPQANPVPDRRPIALSSPSSGSIELVKMVVNSAPIRPMPKAIRAPTRNEPSGKVNQSAEAPTT